MKHFKIFFLILIIFWKASHYMAAASIEPQIVNFLGGFKAARVVNNILYCATEGGLRIYDITDRSNPRVLSETIISESLNVDLEVAGSTVYILTGYIFLEQSYIIVVDVSNPSQPKIQSIYSTLEDAQVTDLLIHDQWLIVANGENIDILDRTNPNRLKRVARSTVTTFEGSVRGLALYNQTLFAVWENFGDSGLIALDISDFSKPEQIVTYYFPRLNGFQRPSGFLTLSGSTLYVSVPTLGLLIFDAEIPEYLVPVTSLEGETFFNVDAIYAKDKILFMDLQKVGIREMAIFDISTPTSPSLISQPSVAASVIGMDFDAERKEAYLGIFPAGGFGIGIFQVTEYGNLNPLATHTVTSALDVKANKGRIFLAASDGLVSGRIVNGKFAIQDKLALSDPTGSLKIVGARAYLTTTNRSGRSFLNTIDVRDPADMKLLGKFLLKGVPGYLSYDTFDVERNHIYFVGANGLTILDGTDPDNPRKVGFFPIHESFEPGMIDVENGLAYIGTLHWRTSNGTERKTLDLHVIDVRSPGAPKLLAKQTISGATVLTDIAVKDGFLYIMFAGSGSSLLPVGDGQLAIVDIGVSTRPEIVFSGFTRKRGKGYAEDIAFKDHLAFIADGLEGVTVLNLANPFRPEILTTLVTPGHARSVAVDNAGLVHITDGISYVVYDWP